MLASGLLMIKIGMDLVRFRSEEKSDNLESKNYCKTAPGLMLSYPAYYH